MPLTPAHPSNRAIRQIEKQLNPEGRLWFLLHDPAPGVAPFMLPEYTADAWRALDENTRYGLLYDQGLRAWYAPEATAKRTAARAKARQTRRARIIRENVADRVASGAPRPHGTAPLCWPATITPAEPTGTHPKGKRQNDN